MLAVIFIYALSSFGREQRGNQNVTTNMPPCNNNGTALTGVIMSIQNVTPNGLSFTFENNAKEAHMYGEAYTLYILQDDSWEPVEPVIEGSWGFFSIGYGLAPNTKTDMISVDWTWLYGELTAGHYKFQKDIVYTRSPDVCDRYVFEQEFSIQFPLNVR